MTRAGERQRLFDALLKEVRGIVDGPGTADEKLRAVCVLLAARVAHYNWVGFYVADPAKKEELQIGPFVGEPTDHVRIPFARGVCGRAAALKKSVVVQDVSKVADYLSCSVNVKSEIVVPIMKGGEVAGEIDIDSHELSPFTGEDTKFLEKVCEAVSKLF
jgi:GAF domain-containing protein